jgi:uncharacterized YccA/Bax inhibitor family protein
MIRPALTEIGIFLIPFGLYALFLFATRAGLLDPSSWPLRLVARLVVGSLLLMLASFVLFAYFAGGSPYSTYVPAHIENGRLVPGVER